MAKRFDGDQILALWHTVPATEYLTSGEFNDIFPVFFEAIEDMRSHIRLQDSGNWQDFMDYMGFSDESLRPWWSEFREWYDAG